MKGKKNITNISNITLGFRNSVTNIYKDARLSIITNKNNSPRHSQPENSFLLGKMTLLSKPCPLINNNLLITSRKTLPFHKDKDDINVKQKDKSKQLKVSLSDSNLKITKNFNSFKHLVTNTHLVFSDLEWILRLRNIEPSIPTKSYPPLTTSFNPPSFFEEDNRKHKSKFLQRSNSGILTNPFHTTENSFKLSHLAKDIGDNRINNSMLSFSTSLRDYKSLKSNSITHMQSWKNLAYNPKVNERRVLPPVIQSSKRNLMSLNNFLIKDYEKVMQKITYEGNTLLKKTMKQSDVSITDCSGEHMAMRKYCDDYGSNNKNLAMIRHLLEEHNNSLSLYEMNMRNYNKGDHKNIKKRIMLKCQGNSNNNKDVTYSNLKKKIKV